MSVLAARASQTGSVEYSLTSADARTVSWAEYGDPNGKPVMLFHGGPGCRLPIALRQAEIAHERRARLICPDRPGFGRSGPQPERSILGWVDDVSRLADALGIARFAVIGYSAGAPYALACGARMAMRVTEVVTVGCAAPPEAAELSRQMDLRHRLFRFVALHTPSLLRLFARGLADPRHRADKLVAQLFGGLGEPDQELLARREVFALLREHTIEAMAQGSRATADEIVLLWHDWGFRLEEVTVPVTVWSGTLDGAAPLAGAEYLVRHLPSARLSRLDGQGHLAIIEHWPAILESAL